MNHPSLFPKLISCQSIARQLQAGE
uniref:Uncharacterized protein n=1 Tax=Arundo donax TaxID=35708 RepID=A0A0A9C526_ARUDO